MTKRSKSRASSNHYESRIQAALLQRAEVSNSYSCCKVSDMFYSNHLDSTIIMWFWLGPPVGGRWKSSQSNDNSDDGGNGEEFQPTRTLIQGRININSSRKLLSLRRRCLPPSACFLCCKLCSRAVPAATSTIPEPFQHHSDHSTPSSSQEAFNDVSDLT